MHFYFLYPFFTTISTLSMLQSKHFTEHAFKVTLPFKKNQLSPHKIQPKVFQSSINTFSHFDGPLNSKRKVYEEPQTSNSIKRLVLKKEINSHPETCTRRPQNETSPPPCLLSVHTNPKIKLPTNPFEQILNQSDTPDFNLSLPFTDDFSKIDLKSPTFSDIFTISEIKSPQFKVQNPQFFRTARKKPHETKEHFNNTVKVGSNFRKDDEGEEKFLEKMDRCIEEMKIQNLQINNGLKSINSNNNKDHSLQKGKKPSIGYKLKNHFNPSTPNVSKQTEFGFVENVPLQKNKTNFNFVSTQSNPEEEGKIVNPIAIAYPKSPRIYKFGDIFSNEQTQKRQQKTKQKAFSPNLSQKQASSSSISYKMDVPRRELKGELQEIYSGKFKIQRPAQT